MTTKAQAVEASRRYRERHPERALQATKDWQARNPEKVKANGSNWRAANPDKMKEHQLKYQVSRYNLTVEQYEEMLAAQGGCCAICGKDEPGGTGRWHIDHDHECCDGRKRSCGKCVRGLLCSSCNLGLGRFEDNENLLQRAAAYLVRTAEGGDAL